MGAFFLVMSVVLASCSSPIVSLGRTATMSIKRPEAFYRKLLLKTDVGFAEAFMDGDVTTEDLAELLRVLLDNRDRMADFSSWTAYAAKTAEYLWHYFWRAPGDEAMAKKNVREHYDLTGLFHYFLDDTMSYSCALFQSPDDSLLQAQTNKIADTVQQLRLAPGMSVLEIGCGWGSLSFAIAAAGCKVHGLTLSEEQYAHCMKEAKRRNLTALASFELVDYQRHVSVTGYDRIVSIEMLEAVGHAYLGAFFRTCDRLLRPDGLLFVQVITMSDARYQAYRVRPDFINTYIFPGGCCPSLTALVDAATADSSLQIESLSNHAPHYARTLMTWDQKFQDAWPEICKTGQYTERFYRMWHYYFRYCEVAFANRTIGLHRILWTRSCNLSALPQCPGY